MKYTVITYLEKVFPDDAKETKSRGYILGVDGAEHESGAVDVHVATEGLIERRKNAIRALVNAGNYDMASVRGGAFDYEYAETWISENGVDSVTFRVQDSALLDKITI